MRISGHLIPFQDPQGWTPSLVGDNHIELAVTLRLWDEEGAYHRMRERQQPFEGEELWAKHGVPQDVRDKIRAWLVESGLIVIRESPLVFWMEGTFEAATETFQIGFDFRQGPEGRLYRLNQEPDVPDWAAPWIAGIVGLENVVRLHSLARRPRHTESLANGGQGFFPADLKTAYGFPQQFDGSNQTVGILEFSNGYAPSDLDRFWREMGIAPPRVDFVSVDGTTNDGGANPQDMEATLDIEWAGAMAPGAHLVVYEASAGRSDQSFGTSMLKALDHAVHDTTHRPTVLSISYGDAETRFPVSEMHAWNSVMAEGGLSGITTFVASGDQGAYGVHGPGRPIRHVDAPANCPHAVSVGGTHLVLNADGSIQGETGWTDTDNNGASGGGISQVFPVPNYQSSEDLPVKPGDKLGRGVPDVAANADPDTGYAIIFQGSMTAIGGTSAACPLWAALWAVLNQARSQAGKGPIGYSNPDLYNLGPTAAFHDITQGDNSYGWVTGYACGPGWDAVTGWGSPNAARLVGELS